MHAPTHAHRSPFARFAAFVGTHVVALMALLPGCKRRTPPSDQEATSPAPPPAPTVETRPDAATASSADAAVPDARIADAGPPTECRAAILVYHRVSPHGAHESRMVRMFTVSPEAFERQMTWLHDHRYQVVPLSRVADCVEGRAPLPERAAVINFDDGYSGPYRYALPVLQRYGMTATFFIVTDQVAGSINFLTWDQVRTLHAADMTIGAHTMSHPQLPRIRDDARLANEIAGGKRIIEEQIHAPVTLFAYPYGMANARVMQAVRDAGFRAARGTDGGTLHRERDRFALKSLTCTDDMAAFARQIEQ